MSAFIDRTGESDEVFQRKVLDRFGAGTLRDELAELVEEHVALLNTDEDPFIDALLNVVECHHAAREKTAAADALRAASKHMTNPDDANKLLNLAHNATLFAAALEEPTR